MNKIFIACPISKYVDGDRFINNDFKNFIKGMYRVCQQHASEVFLALEREKYGKNLMTDTCTVLDFAEMKTADLVVAIPEDSKGTAVELGWASWMQKELLILLDCNQRYTPLISGLGDITDTEIIWYDGELDETVLSEVDHMLRKKRKE